MSLRRVLCPAYLEVGEAERAMLEAIPLAPDGRVESVMWCELDHDPANVTDTEDAHGVDPSSILHVSGAQVGNDVWWVRWSADGKRRELTAVPLPCQFDNGLPAGQDESCSLPAEHEGRHSWALGPE